MGRHQLFGQGKRGLGLITMKCLLIRRVRVRVRYVDADRIRIRLVLGPRAPELHHNYRRHHKGHKGYRKRAHQRDLPRARVVGVALGENG